MTDSPVAQLVPPVVIISACGLLCLAQFSRYSSIIGRLRGMHRERVEGLAKLCKLHGHELTITRERCDLLETQSHQLLALAKMIRNALLLLVLAVILMILSSLAIGLEQLQPRTGVTLTVTFFIAGMISMLIGMMFVFREVMLSLSLVEQEHQQIEQIQTPEQNEQGSEP